MREEVNLESIMDMTANERVKRFIDDTLSIAEEKGALLLSLRKIIKRISPDAQEEIKYGGLVFNADAELICGIFIRKKHISLEFGLGNEFSDPKRVLEGNGKYRRHLKIRSNKDIKRLDVQFFVAQAFDL